jgi:ribosomal protein S18 acetylase RimI-like enzyme
MLPVELVEGIRCGLGYNFGMATLSKSSITLRPANPDDANAAAALIYETMATLGEYLFGQPDAKGAVRTLAVVFRERGHLFSHQFTTLAEVKNEIVGIAQAFPGADLWKVGARLVQVCGKCFGLTAALRFAWRGFPLAVEPDAENGEFYINTLAVAPSQRNRGIGRVLLQNAERQAKKLNFPVCSLGVLLENANAKRFYERAGYREDGKFISRLRAPGVQYTGFYRMIKEINGEGSAAKGAPKK